MNVSVVIPAHNAAPYLADAIESVLAQTVAPADLLVIDDGSTDETGAVAEGFGDRVQLHRQKQAGAGAARNRGIELASGDALAFLDADDVWMPRKLELQLGAFASDGSLELVFGNVEHFFSPDLGAERQKVLRMPAGLLAESVPGLVPGTALIRREALLRVGRFATGLGAGEGLDWYARTLDAGLRTLVLDEVVLRRRIHAGNGTIRRPDAVNDYPRVLRTILERRRRDL